MLMHENKVLEPLVSRDLGENERSHNRIFPESSGRMFYALYWLVIYIPVGSQVYDLPNMFEQF